MRFLYAFVFFIIISCGVTKINSNKTKHRTLTMLTYNIHHGAPEKSNDVNLRNIAAVIRKSGADLVALQEVDVNVPRSGNVNQAQELAKLLNMHYYFSKSINYNGGEYGVAILSKYKFVQRRNEILPMPSAGEQRSVAIARVNLPGNVAIDFASTHLDLNVPNRMAQVEYLNKLNRQQGSHALFIGGDYNAEPHSSEINVLKEEFNLSCFNNSCPLSFPVKAPTKAIDFVVFSQSAAAKFVLASSETMVGEFASDHLPVKVVFNYK